MLAPHRLTRDRLSCFLAAFGWYPSASFFGAACPVSTRAAVDRRRNRCPAGARVVSGFRNSTFAAQIYRGVAGVPFGRQKRIQSALRAVLSLAFLLTWLAGGPERLCFLSSSHINYSLRREFGMTRLSRKVRERTYPLRWRRLFSEGRVESAASITARVPWAHFTVWPIKTAWGVSMAPASA